MKKTIAYPRPVDLARYRTVEADLIPLYGLPRQVEFCRRCSYSNQKPNSEREYKHTIGSKKPTVQFDEFGICSACRVAEKKKDTNWVAREAELRDLCDRYRRKDGYYDCVVPGSGGKDSVYASHKLKYEYGMNPLTVTWAPHIYTDWGWKNFQSWIQSGVDNYLFTPNGRVHRLLTRLALEKIFHPFQPFITGQMYFPPKLAIKMGIPLVFYGENPVEYGNQSKDGEKATKDTAYFTAADRSSVHLSGIPIGELMGDFGLSAVDLEPYTPPDLAELERAKIDVRYLGYYLPWHPQECYYYAVEKSGFKAAPERTTGTYSKYSSIDDRIDDLHYYTTFIKFGIGRATYDSAQEIRNGEIIREEAIALVRRFDGEYPIRFEKECLEYLSIPEKDFPVASKMFDHPNFDRSYFDRLTDQFRSPHLWAENSGSWTLRHTIWNEAERRGSR